MAKSMQAGGGGAFQKLTKKLAGKPGIKDPKALAASMGRKKYGKGQFQEMAAKGKERATAEKGGKPKPALPKFTPKEPGLSEALSSATSKLKK